MSRLFACLCKHIRYIPASSVNSPETSSVKCVLIDFVKSVLTTVDSSTADMTYSIKGQAVQHSQHLLSIRVLKSKNTK